VRSGDSGGFTDTVGGGGGHGRVHVLSGEVAGGVPVGSRAPREVLAVVALSVGD